MRIVLVNWARLWDGAGFGGGVNGYCQSLALELVKRGHDVVSLFGGTTFVPAPTPDQTSPCFVRRHDDWLGVRIFEIVNSPVMAPSIVQYQRPLDEVSSPELEREVERLFAMLKPDVVHFHNIEGFSIGCVAAAKRAGAATLFSLHNYHTICPQVYLMQGHHRVCFDSRNGHNCTNCIKTKDPIAERRERAAAYAKPKTGDAQTEAEYVVEEYQKAWGGFKHEFSWPVRVVKKGLELLERKKQVDALRRDASVGPAALPGHAVASSDDATRPMPPKLSPWNRKHVKVPPVVDQREGLLPQFRTDDERGQTQAIMRELDKLAKQREGLDNPDARRGEPLLNIVQPDPPCDLPLNDYGERRLAMVRMLSSCDRVLAVSNFVRSKFVSMGVNPDAIQTLAIGSRIGQVAEQSREMVFDPPPFPAAGDPAYQSLEGVRPVRLVFMGYNNYYKGLHVLAQALEVLTPEYLRRLDLSIFALDGHSIEWIFRRLEPRLAKLVFVHGYSFHDIPWMLGGKDLGVVPSVWWDNAPQTVFEFFGCGVPVLGAAVGGIPDFVIDGHNGMLFRGNDPYDLARRLVETIREPWRLTEMRRHVQPPKGMEAHAIELESLYQTCAGKSR